MKTRILLPLALAAITASAPAFVGCGPARSPDGSHRSPIAQKWLDRVKASYSGADMEDAWDSARSAMQASAEDTEIRTWVKKPCCSPV